MFISAPELVGRLPDPTAVTTSEAKEYIDAAVEWLGDSHAEGEDFETARTREMVAELSYAKAIRLHYIKGEAEIDTKPLDDAVAEAKKDFYAYDASHTTEEEQEIEAPRAIVQEVPW